MNRSVKDKIIFLMILTISILGGFSVIEAFKYFNLPIGAVGDPFANLMFIVYAYYAFDYVKNAYNYYF